MPKTKRGRGVRLEMTSLMDVMFLILVFFIYAIFNMSVRKGMKVDLPEGRGAVEEGERIVLTIAPNDALQFNGVDVSRDEALRRVRELYAVNMKLPVLISGDRKASLGMGVGLLSALKELGVEKVSFQLKEVSK